MLFITGGFAQTGRGNFTFKGAVCKTPGLPRRVASAPASAFFTAQENKTFEINDRVARGGVRRPERRESIGPLVIVELRGVVLAVAALHGDAAGQDGGDVVAEVVPLLLLALGLHLTQVEP